MSGKLDPEVEQYLRQTAQPEAPPLETVSPEEMRQVCVDLVNQFGGIPELVADIRDLQIDGPAGAIPIRVFTPEGSGPFPVLIYFHGGGWVMGDPSTHENITQPLTNRTGCVTVSVDYRLAPEHIFPAAVEDAYATTRWVVENSDSINGDGNRIAVGGDSAGGNLAAAVCLKARNERGPSLAYQLLLYPALDLSSFGTDSYRECGEGYGLPLEMMEWCRGHYLPAEPDRLNPYASPLVAEDLTNLPPALILTAEFDPLRDEGAEYANRLKDAGIAVKYSCYDGMVHGFLSVGGAITRAKDAIDEAASELRAIFKS